MDCDKEDYQISQTNDLSLLFGDLIVGKDQPGLVDLLHLSLNNVLVLTHGDVTQICTQL